MRVECLQSWSEAACILDQWTNWSANNPMLSPVWLETWWNRVGAADPHNRLLIACVYQGQRLLGIAPWYLSQSIYEGNTIRFLADGRTCSDHHSLICPIGEERAVAVAIGQWLVSKDMAGRWDSLQFEAVDEDDLPLSVLQDNLADSGYQVRVTANHGSWSVALPEDWSNYLQSISKNHRKRCRRWLKTWVDSGRAQLVPAKSDDEIATGLDLFEQLHTSRRDHRGDIGLFACHRQRDFLRSVFPVLQQQGKARLTVLHVDGEPVACEYLLLSRDSVFAYQSGMSADHLDIAAGNISVLLSIKWAIEHGYSEFDFLRGNELYKQSWGALWRPANTLAVFGKSWRGTLQQTLQDSKQWLKSAVCGTSLTQPL